MKLFIPGQGGTLPIPVLADPAGQVLAAVLDHHAVLAIGEHNINQLDDVGMPQLLKEMHFAEELLTAILFVSFDEHRGAQPR